jgi:hypothetical protein
MTPALALPLIIGGAVSAATCALFVVCGTIRGSHDDALRESAREDYQRVIGALDAAGDDADRVTFDFPARQRRQR